MRNTFAAPPGLGASPTAGPVTRGLIALLIAVSLAASLSGRYGGLGPQALIFNRDAILHGEVWRLLSYAFVEAGSPIGLLLSCLMLFLFGGIYEQRWGSVAYLRFFVLATLGGALFALPLGSLISLLLPLEDSGLAQGPNVAIEAMIVVTAVQAPNTQVLFGFVLPLQVRHLVMLVIGLQLASGIMTGVASLGILLGGMLMGYLLTTELWRPSRIVERLRLWRLMRRRNRGLYVVPPRGRGRRDLN